jgi:hypothetical protein
MHRSYCLVAVVIAGSDIPQFKSLVHIGSLSKMSVRVTIGPVAMTSSRQPSAAGEVSHGVHASMLLEFEVFDLLVQIVWGEVLRHDRLTLPQELNEIPDIFVYIVDRQDRYEPNVVAAVKMNCVTVV